MSKQLRLNRILKSLQKPAKNQRGIALMLAVTCIMLIMWIALEVSYDSNVEYLVNAQNLNRVKAYYAAKSGVKLSLLRVKLYGQAKEKMGSVLNDTSMLDQIWKFPFAWPLPLPDEVNAVDKDSFKTATSESLMDANYMVTIQDESSKIDLTDLISPSKQLQDQTKAQLLNVFKQKMNADEAFARENSNTNFEELINSIQDYMSPKAMSDNGGDKRAAYSELNSENKTDFFPPNHAFRTIAELRFVPGMNEEFYSALEPLVTLVGLKGVNPNLASAEMLKSLDPGMTDEIVAEIIKRRDDEDEGGKFSCDKDGGSPEFWEFAQSKGLRTEGEFEKVPLTCDSPLSFRIRSSASFANSAREIIVVTVDTPALIKKIKAQIKKDQSKDAGGGGETDKDKDKDKSKPPTEEKEKEVKGPPQIILWNER